MTERYYTRAGEPTTLEALVRAEPEWAASRIREGERARFERDELLAIIHRDGGHYVGEHGITKAVADAHATWAAVVAERDRLRAELEALRDDLRGDADDSRAGMDHDHANELDDIARSIDAILSGGES